MMNIDTYTAEFVVKYEIMAQTGAQDYLRLQTESSLGMDKVSAKDVIALKQDGEKLWDENQEQVKTMLRQIIDERWG